MPSHGAHRTLTFVKMTDDKIEIINFTMNFYDIESLKLTHTRARKVCHTFFNVFIINTGRNMSRSTKTTMVLTTKSLGNKINDH